MGSAITGAPVRCAMLPFPRCDAVRIAFPRLALPKTEWQNPARPRAVRKVESTRTLSLEARPVCTRRRQNLASIRRFDPKYCGLSARAASRTASRREDRWPLSARCGNGPGRMDCWIAGAAVISSPRCCCTPEARQPCPRRYAQIRRTLQADRLVRRAMPAFPFLVRRSFRRSSKDSTLKCSGTSWT